MTVRQLINRLKKHDPKVEIFFENRINPTGNINTVDNLEESTYGFFGKDIPCVIIRHKH